MREAVIYEKRFEGNLKCGLCTHRPTIKDGNYVICGVRQNGEGSLYTLVCHKIAVSPIDPIEKNHYSNSTLVPRPILLLPWDFIVTTANEMIIRVGKTI